MGQTTIAEVPGNPPASHFQITSYFDVYAELQIDKGPFVPGPERLADLSETPEPTYFGAIGVLLSVMVAYRAIKLKSRALDV